MINSQFELFVLFILNGLIIGFLFDFFRILRKIFKTSNIITYIEDVLFWIFTGFIILYTIFIYNDGEVRFFMFLAIFLGILIYLLLISKFFIKFSLTIINFIKQILHIICIPLIYLLKLFKKILFKPILFIIINLRNNFTKYFKNIYKLLEKTNISNKFVKNTKN